MKRKLTFEPSKPDSGMLLPARVLIKSYLHSCCSVSHAGRLIMGLVLMAALSSCEYESMERFNMGNDFLNDPTKVVMIDTMTVFTSTILSDSVVTSQGSRILAGRCKDKMGVETYAEGYFRLEPPVFPKLHELAEFDSAVFILYLDGYWLGDTTQVANFNIYQVGQEMKYDEDTRAFYQFNRYQHHELPMASFSVDLESLDDDQDSVVVKLPLENGKIFYDMVADSVETVANADTFKLAYPGFVIKPADENPAYVAGFFMEPDTLNKPKLRVYYHDNQINDKYFHSKDLYFDYPLLSSDDSCKYYAWSHIENNFQGTPFEGLKSEESFNLPSSQTNEITMIQGGVNARTRIEIPYLDNLYNLGYGAIIKAVLFYNPVEDYYDDEFYKLPPTMSLFLLDKKNRNQSSSPIPLLNTNNSSAYATLYQNSDFDTPTVYTFDVTRYIKDEYDSKAISKYKLGLSLPIDSIITRTSSYTRLVGNSVDRVYIGSPKNQKNQMKLKVYMSIN